MWSMVDRGKGRDEESENHEKNLLNKNSCVSLADWRLLFQRGYTACYQYLPNSDTCTVHS